MHDAMMTWDWICQSQWFKQTPLVRVLCSPHGHAYTSQILIWNNNDLFERKIVHSDIKNFFPDYKGPPGDAEAGREYFEMCFIGISTKPGGSTERNVFSHLPTTQDTKMLQRIISNVEECVSLVRRSAPARQRIALPHLFSPSTCRPQISPCVCDKRTLKAARGIPLECFTRIHPPFAMSGSSPHSLLGCAPSPLHDSHTSSLCACRGAMHNFLTVGAIFALQFDHRHRNGLLRSSRAYRTRSYPNTDDPDRQPHQCADLRPYRSRSARPDTSLDSHLHPLDIRFSLDPDPIRPAPR
jgi:hypothetical protein